MSDGALKAAGFKGLHRRSCANRLFKRLRDVRRGDDEARLADEPNRATASSRVGEDDRLIGADMIGGASQVSCPVRVESGEEVGAHEDGRNFTTSLCDVKLNIVVSKDL